MRADPAGRRSRAQRRTLRSRRGGARAALGILTTLLVLAGCASPGPSGSFRGMFDGGRADPGSYYRVERFRIGWYDDILNPETPVRLADLGFDSVMPYVGSREASAIAAFLDAAGRSGIGVHLEIPRARVRDSESRALEEYVESWKGRSSVLSWYLYDEPEWKPEARPSMLKKAYSRIRTADPGRPVDLVFFFPFLSGPYRGALDVLWLDHYPVAHGSSEYSVLRSGAYSDRMKSFGRRADRYGVPLTLVLQGFGEREDGSAQVGRRLPTPRETRYMFWASFLARPSELLYWTLYRTRESWLVDVLVPVVREFRSLFPGPVEYLPDPGFRVEGGRADTVLLGDGAGGRFLAVLSREATDRDLEIGAPEGWSMGPAGAPSVIQTDSKAGPFAVQVLEVSEIP